MRRLFIFLLLLPNLSWAHNSAHHEFEFSSIVARGLHFLSSPDHLFGAMVVVSAVIGAALWARANKAQP